MSDVQLRLPLGLGHRLRELVYARATHEVVAFCLVGHAQIGPTTVLLVRNVVALGENEYVEGSHGAMWRGSSMIPVIECAVDEGLGIVLVHAHDFAAKARLSLDDLTSARRLVPMFQARVPERPHGSIVLGRGTAAGYIALPGHDAELVENVRVRWFGQSIVDWPGIVGDPTLELEVFDRQALVVGDQAQLTSATVAVVGLCGGGSPVVQNLALAGVGTIIGIDDDVCERTGQHRVVGMQREDWLRGAPKIDVMSRLVGKIDTGARFVGIDARVPEPRTLDALVAADVIVGAVDNLRARADLMDVAARFAIPYVDIGVTIRALESMASEPRVAIGGNVYVFIPGGFCAWCCDFVSDAKLRAERQGRDDRSYFQNKAGQAQVASFNAAVAGAAVSEVIQLLTAYRGSLLDPAALQTGDARQRGALKFDGLRGTHEDWGAVQRADCPRCSVMLCAGSLIWRHAA